MALELDVKAWAQEQFGDCQLGDARRTRRAVKVAAQFAGHPSGSTPQQTGCWADLKAVYRLLGEEDVTFQALAEPHWRLTRARTSGHYLVLGDTTTISCGTRKVQGAGLIEGRTTGYMLHSALMVDAATSEVIGLAGQAIHYRQPAPKLEQGHQRRQRPRESELWGQVIDQVGPPPENVRWTHVFDRGADNYDVYCHLLSQRCDWIMRLAQLKRRVCTTEGRSVQLAEYLDALPASGAYELQVQANHKQQRRTAKVEVRYGSITVPRPKKCSPYARQSGSGDLTVYIVEVREVAPPKGAQPLRWVLSTSHPVASFVDACRVIGYYEQRPLVEEFHKGLKTGCQIEQRQYESTEPLEPLTAFLSVISVRLLQLRSESRTRPERPAQEVVPSLWLTVLGKVRQRGKPIVTVRDFYRALAGLGGFLGRKHDGEPGWMTLWRGFEKLHPCLQMADTLNHKCG